MPDRSRTRTGFAAAMYLSLAMSAFAYAPAQPQAPSTILKEKKAIMTSHASGTFDVKMTPQSAADKAEDASVGRYSLDKQFHGDLVGTSKGEMLAVGTAVEGSAGYVAMEQVKGTLNGRSGSFALQHTGTMTRGAAELSVTVVPDSGTGQLIGLAGKMTIKIDAGKHFYDFEYTLAEVSKQKGQI
jgi:hypothetical protein